MANEDFIGHSVWVLTLERHFEGSEIVEVFHSMEAAEEWVARHPIPREDKGSLTYAIEDWIIS